MRPGASSQFSHLQRLKVMFSLCSDQTRLLRSCHQHMAPPSDRHPPVPTLSGAGRLRAARGVCQLLSGGQQCTDRQSELGAGRTSPVRSSIALFKPGLRVVYK